MSWSSVLGARFAGALPPWLRVVFWGCLPGGLGGLHLAILLFFLNPAFPFSPGTLLRTAAVYVPIIGVVSFVVCLPWTWARPHRARRAVPWALTVMLALAALGYWIHASRLAFFLPPGINARMIKAAVLISGAALISFYTALLHSLNRRPYGKKSRIGLVLLAMASVVVSVERRQAFAPIEDTSQTTFSVSSRPRPRLLVVGLEGATLEAVLPLAEQGRLPFLANVLRRGAGGRLGSLQPHRREALWASLSTGKYPYRHEILGPLRHQVPFFSPDAELSLLPARIGLRFWGLPGGRARALRRTDQRALPLWELLQRANLSAAMIGWPATDPVSRELQVALAERLFTGLEEGSPVQDCAQPPDAAERARLFRLELAELDPVLLGRFGKSPPRVILQALAADQWRNSLALFLLEQPPRPDAAFLLLPGLADVSHELFGGFAAAELGGATGIDQVRAAELVSAYYSYVDSLLAELWRRRGESGLLAVVSASGFRGRSGLDDLWETLTSPYPQGGTQRWAPDGVFFLYGEGVRRETRLTNAALIDVAPTLLYALGLPVARDLDGKVLTGAFEEVWRENNPLAFVQSYEALPSRLGR